MDAVFEVWGYEVEVAKVPGVDAVRVDFACAGWMQGVMPLLAVTRPCDKGLSVLTVIFVWPTV